MSAMVEDPSRIGTMPWNADSCDESKCVSGGIATSPHNDSFTCLGNGSTMPLMCADGFVPVVVANEEPVFTRRFGNLTYHTCCPPQDDTVTYPTDMTRHCSDPIATPRRQRQGLGLSHGGQGRPGDHRLHPRNDRPAFDNQEDAHELCRDQGTRKYFRPMTPMVKKPFRGNIESLRLHLLGDDPEKNFYLCCDSELATDNTTTTTPDLLDTNDFLEDTECVPYNDEFYQSHRIRNQIGVIRPITCDFPDGSFVVPRPFDNSMGIAESGRYQCCRTGTPHPAYIQDSAFKITIYLPMALWCLSALVAATVWIGLLIPLIVELVSGRHQEKAQHHHRRRRSSIERHKSDPPPYSPDNLYLVYLAFLDFAFSTINIICYSEAVRQLFSPNLYGPYITTQTNEYSVTDTDELFTQPYVFANMWINSIICHQVLVLLSSSQRLQRMSRPSLKKVNLQAAFVVLMMFVYLGIHWILRIAAQRAGRDRDFERVRRLGIVTFSFTIVVLAIPFLYVVGTMVLICHRGYMRPALHTEAIDKSMCRLGWFLFRIVAVFVGIWIPYYVSFYILAGRNQPRWFLVGSCIIAIQPILSAGIILTKPDARKYILDLVTLSYCRRCCCHKKEHDEKLPTISRTGPSSDTGSPEDDVYDDDPESRNAAHEDPEIIITNNE